jgi:hypothetical protein
MYAVRLRYGKRDRRHEMRAPSVRRLLVSQMRLVAALTVVSFPADVPGKSL